MASMPFKTAYHLVGFELIIENGKAVFTIDPTNDKYIKDSVKTIFSAVIPVSSENKKKCIKRYSYL